MLIRHSLIASIILASQSLAGTALVAPATVIETEAKPFFTGSFTAGAATNYTGRGYVTSRTAMEGEGVEFMALKLDHEVNENWSINSTLAYTISSSGHTLYGNPSYHPYYASINPALTGPIKECNLENELVLSSEARYSQEKWSIGIGADYVHGGLLGVMAKHFADQGASSVTEFFLSPEYSPYKWVSINCPIRYSVQGVTGWWIEPSVTFKAPLIGTAEDVKLAALLSFNISIAADYFQDYHGACNNGSQAFWVKLSTPYFVDDAKKWILTPSVSFNWLGHGAMKANKKSAYKQATMDSSYVPYQNFAVVGSISCTYVF